MDTLDINDVRYDRKILDLQRRYDEQYDIIEEIKVQIGELQSQIRSIQQEKISRQYLSLVAGTDEAPPFRNGSGAEGVCEGLYRAN